MVSRCTVEGRVYTVHQRDLRAARTLIRWELNTYTPGFQGRYFAASRGDTRPPCTDRQTIHVPGPVRPARPDRWSTAAREQGKTCEGEDGEIRAFSMDEWQLPRVAQRMTPAMIQSPAVSPCRIQWLRVRTMSGKFWASFGFASLHKRAFQ